MALRFGLSDHVSARGLDGVAGSVGGGAGCRDPGAPAPVGGAAPAGWAAARVVGRPGGARRAGPPSSSGTADPDAGYAGDSPALAPAAGDPTVDHYRGAPAGP